MTFNPPKTRDNLIWAAVDFDGTIAESTWSIDNPNATPGEPIARNVLKLNALVALGYKIVIHTSRSWADYEILEAWLNHYRITFDKIVCGKVLAERYIDDRAIWAEDDWLART